MAEATERMSIRYDDEKHKYWIDGDEVPSVTQLLDNAVPKEALGWWSYRVGLAAVAKMVQDGVISYPILQTAVFESIVKGRPLPDQVAYTLADTKKRKPKTLIEARAIDAKLHPNAIRDQRGDEGTAVHNAITMMGVTEELPNLEDHPEHLRGFLQALAKWWLEQEPTYLEQEVIVGTRKYGYAGRLDLICEISDLRCMVDFKTSSAIRESHDLQMRGYETPYLECGGDPLDKLLVVNLRDDGTYVQAPVVSTKADWLAAMRWAKQRMAFLPKFEAQHGI